VSATRPIRVLLADDHTLVRAGIRALIQNLDGVEVIAETGDGQEALRLAEELRPDVLLLDVAMPGLNGLDTAARASKLRIRVLILSMHANEEYVLRALRAGASGYIVKDAATTELEIAIRAAVRGEIYLSPAVSRHVIEAYVDRLGGEESPLEHLTPRQREILQLIAEGQTTKAIAIKLGLSAKTVETHRMQLMKRLDVHDIASLVRHAIRLGLVNPER
jgi:DNA-binding NarL/FixJ family response regulator